MSSRDHSKSSPYPITDARFFVWRFVRSTLTLLIALGAIFAVCGAPAVAQASVPVTADFSSFTLKSGDTLSAGGQLGLAMQTDGNLVLYDNEGTVNLLPLWSSSTTQSCPAGTCALNFQSDGNLVIYQGSTAYWNTSTFGTGYKLRLSNAFPFISIVTGTGQVVWSPYGVTADLPPFSLTSGSTLPVGLQLGLTVQTDGNMVLYNGIGTSNLTSLWGSNAFQSCSGGACAGSFQSDGNWALYKGANSYWNSSTFGSGYQLRLSDSYPFVAIHDASGAYVWGPYLGSSINFQPNKPHPSSGISGWVSGYSAGGVANAYLDGVISAWAIDWDHPYAGVTLKLYSDGQVVNGVGSGGTLVQTGVTNAPVFQTLYDYGAPQINHGFSFKIPDALKDNQNHNFYVNATSADGLVTTTLSQAFASFKLSAIASTSTVTSSACLTPSTACNSTAYDYNGPNFNGVTGWSDEVNYFAQWKCSSSTGINYIARLNIIPAGSHDNNFQKDSTYVNPNDSALGGNIIYFTASRYNGYSSTYSLKKAVWDGGANQWRIYDMLDAPSSIGGFSSLDGTYPNFIMNDYAQPGWGPTSPLGSGTTLPGVSRKSLNPEQNSFALEGMGPLGLTAVRNYVQNTGTFGDGSQSGRTCIHMNPKLYDFDANGVPHSMAAFLFEGDTSHACTLPDGSTLPAAAYYAYRYDPVSGWQLDKAFGPIGLSQGTPPAQAMKLVWGTSGTFIAGTWGGQIQTLNAEKPAPQSWNTVLDCSAAPGGAPHFGEATGSTTQIWFLGSPSVGYVINPTGPVFVADIYYAFHR
ncbi:hypothetical protein RKE25_10715 [Dyella sp. BiH032]|uniref:hypothetical protein n=1 Tax=Dyella sp. BiH032 TaxID=3075430 RepID=UPI002892BE6C|nr:hypothetical protein [Dyella sp. BiH032]WNL48063.1 hypothetical protein RKE25_10715 [Dyella sp. BiH032]